MDQAEWILAYGQHCMAADPDYKTGLKCGHEAAGPVEVAIQCAQRLKDSGLVQKAEKLKEAIYTFIRLTQWAMLVQARVQADRQLASFGPHPHEEEVWQVVDKYTHALRQTEEQDLLNECRAHARLGGVFDKHLKMRNKAVLNCKRAMQLAHHIKPHPTGHDWYMELEPQLKKIKAAKAKGARDLLVHIKQSHPPKFKGNLAEPAYDNIRQALRKASAEYHPDKQSRYDQKWQVLSGEISKAVNDVWADYCS
ncbi:TPA: hypothetical protein ACH3X3_003344 [Trebouxia sp. C0006]